LDGATATLPQSLLDEADEHGDIVFLKTKEEYKNLPEKVRLFFQYAVDACDPKALRYILKTDDDTFVDVRSLVADLEGQQEQQLLYGRMMRNMPGGTKYDENKKIVKFDVARVLVLIFILSRKLLK
jgi:hypothetical protein